MDYLDYIGKIEVECYNDRKEAAGTLIPDLIDSLIKERNMDERFLPILQLINYSLEKKDFVSVADYLEYGIKPLLCGRVYLESVLNTIPYETMDIEDTVFYMPAFIDNDLCICLQKNNAFYKMSSIFSPENEADVIVESMDIKFTTPVICLFGIGTGLIAEKILKKSSSECKLIIYEPDRMIIDYCISSGENPDSIDLERIISNRIRSVLNDNRTMLYIEENGSRFTEILERNIDYTGLMGLVVGKNAGYTEAYAKSCINFYRLINHFRGHFITDKKTREYFRIDHVDNTFKNLWMFKSSLLCSSLKQILPDDIAIIIVSAGPSLDKNIEELRKAKGHALIFAVDTAVKYLLKKDILPDITITVDPRKPISNFSDARSRSIPCIFGLDANPQIIAEHKGPFIFLNNENGYVENLLNIHNRLTDYVGLGGSVATTAFSVACRLQAKKIILVGQDLAFENGVTHAGGVSEEANYSISDVEDVYGNPIQTRGDWLEYLRWFEEAIDTISMMKDDFLVIDATEGGAKIHGSQIMSLKNAIEGLKDENGHLPEYNFEELLKKIKPILVDEEYVDFCKRHDKCVNDLISLEKEAENAIRICDDLADRILKGKAPDNFVIQQNKKLKFIRKKISESPFASLIGECADPKVLDECAKLELQDGDMTTIRVNLIKSMKLSFDSLKEAIKMIYDSAKRFKNLLD